MGLRAGRVNHRALPVQPLVCMVRGGGSINWDDREDMMRIGRGVFAAASVTLGLATAAGAAPAGLDVVRCRLQTVHFVLLTSGMDHPENCASDNVG